MLGVTGCRSTIRQKGAGKASKGHTQTHTYTHTCVDPSSSDSFYVLWALWRFLRGRWGGGSLGTHTQSATAHAILSWWCWLSGGTAGVQTRGSGVGQPESQGSGAGGTRAHRQYTYANLRREGDMQGVAAVAKHHIPPRPSVTGPSPHATPCRLQQLELLVALLVA